MQLMISLMKNVEVFRSPQHKCTIILDKLSLFELAFIKRSFVKQSLHSNGKFL